MKKFLTLLAVAAMVLSCSAKSQASVLTFDDITTDGFAYIQDGYGGFTWQYPDASTITMDKTAYSFYPGMANIVSSGNYAAVNNYGDNPIIIGLSTGYFDFNSAIFDSLAINNNKISITGYKDDVQVGYDAFDVTNQTSNTYDAGSKFLGINKLVINSNGGVSNDWIAMDDFKYNAAPAPEPTSMLLGLLGFAGAAITRRRKQIQA